MQDNEQVTVESEVASTQAGPVLLGPGYEAKSEATVSTTRRVGKQLLGRFFHTSERRQHP